MKNFLLITAAVLLLGFGAFAQSEAIVHIPNESFKGYLLSHNPVIDTNEDGEISVAEAEAVTGTLNVRGHDFWIGKITDLTGVEAFINITRLYCSHNRLTTLDVSKNTALEVLACDFNQLDSLDVSKNTALRYLNCQGSGLSNQITSLDVSNLISLEELRCQGNPFTFLDVSKNTALTYLNCERNQLTFLDVSNLISLKELRCDGNSLSSLDVSKNMALGTLSCENNSLDSLDVSKNTALTHLRCDNNHLTTLDLSKNTILFSLECNNNQLLSSLNIQNGNNQNLWNDFFKVEGNPKLTCIQVDDANWSRDNWTNVDDFMGFSENCELGTSINKLRESAITAIYPNPASSSLNIELKETTNISVIDMFGTTVIFTSFNHQLNTLDISRLENGIYFLQTENGEALKFVKE